MGGFDRNHAILIYEGKILDGRHRYEAALQAGVDPVFVEFQGTKAGAIAYVTSENVSRRHLNNQEKEFFYEKRAIALGVNERGVNQHRSNDRSSPTQGQHAEAMGVGEATVRRWERDRKEIMADPELAEKATTLEAWEYVNDHNSEDGRRMLSKADLQDFYYAWSESVGVRDKGGANNPEGLGGKSDKASSVIDNRSNGLLSIDSPSQEEFVDKLGMSPSKVKRMEADKRKIAANPEVASEVLSRASKGIRLGALGLSGAGNYLPQLSRFSALMISCCRYANGLPSP